jgi:hypothetical protein
MLQLTVFLMFGVNIFIRLLRKVIYGVQFKYYTYKITQSINNNVIKKQ